MTDYNVEICPTCKGSGKSPNVFMYREGDTVRVFALPFWSRIVRCFTCKGRIFLVKEAPDT